MRFHRYRPGPPLSTFVEDLWSYEGYVSPHAQTALRALGARMKRNHLSFAC